MGKKSRPSSRSKLFWRYAISLVGILLILLAVNNLLLTVIGDTATADVSTRRVGGSNDGRPANARYEWSIDYTFVDSEGNLRSGHTVRRGGDLGVQVEPTVTYYAFAPWLNKLDSTSSPLLGSLVLAGLGVFLIWVMRK